MNELTRVFEREGQLVVSSRRVAEDFGKTHKHVLDSICKIIEQMRSAENSANLFIPSEYADSYGRKQKEYLMTRDGFSLLVMGFNGKAALDWKLKYIDAFNQMEQKWNSPEIVMARAIQFAGSRIKVLEQDNKLLLEENTTMKPKAEFADKITATEDCITIQQFAKILAQNNCDIGAIRLYSYLRNNQYLMKMADHYHTPTQKSAQLKLFKVTEKPYINQYGDKAISITSRLTPKGQRYFLNRIDKINKWLNAETTETNEERMEYI